MKPVRKAVFPVAGLGTRFLPATKAIPKEMLTLVDRPLIQYAVEEAREAGIEQMIFVTGRGKGALEDHFDISYELETTMRERGKSLDPLEPTRFQPGNLVGQDPVQGPWVKFGTPEVQVAASGGTVQSAVAATGTQSLRVEMDFTWRLGKHYAPTELAARHNSPHYRLRVKPQP